MANDAKLYGASLPENPAPAERVGFFICIPDALEYRAAIRGQMDRMARWFFWSHTYKAFNDIPPANIAAETVWGNALTTMEFWENCEPPMTCEQIIECIENNPATQAALFNYLTSSPEFRQWVEGRAVTPVLPTTTTGKNILKPNQCGYDYLFNQVSTLIGLLHSLSIDLFQAIEVGTNALERSNLIFSAIPAIGAVIPVDEILGGVDTFISAFQEDYEGAYNEFLYDDIRCAIFCDVRGDCAMSIDQVIAWYEEAIPQQFPTDPLTAVSSVWEFILTGSTPAAVSVYAMHLFILACMRAALAVLEIDFSRVALRVMAAGDTPDNDWTILCDCVSENGWTTDPSSSVVKNGNTYTITGGVVDGNSTILYIQASVDGVVNLDGVLQYTDLSMQNFETYDWGSAGSPNTTPPPPDAPPPNINYVGGGRAGQFPNTLVITITTDLPYQPFAG